MRVLLTGSRGLLGAAIQREFQPDEVVALDRRSLDITDDGAVRAAIADARPHVVVNCAAYNNVDRAEDEPVAALNANAFGVHSVGRAASDAGAVLVHFSSDFVFDGETERPYTEADEPNPRSVYAASKLLGEWFALACPRVFVLRVESLFGQHGPASAEATAGKEGARRGSLGSIVNGILEGAEVPVFVDRVVSPSYTTDVARAVRGLVESRAAAGLYHCVNTGHATWMEIAERAARILGKPLRPRPLTLATAGLRARRPRYCALSNAKLAAAGFEMRTWEEAIEAFLRPQ